MIADLIKVMGFITYYGCLIEKRGSKYVTQKKKFNTLTEAKDHIDKGFKIIEKSIR